MKYYFIIEGWRVSASLEAYSTQEYDGLKIESMNM